MMKSDRAEKQPTPKPVPKKLEKGVRPPPPPPKTTAPKKVGGK